MFKPRLRPRPVEGETIRRRPFLNISPFFSLKLSHLRTFLIAIPRMFWGAFLRIHLVYPGGSGCVLRVLCQTRLCSDPAKLEIDLEELELYNYVSGKRIIAKKGHLDLKTNTVKVPTSLIKETQGVTVEGKLICLMNLNAFRQSIGDNGAAAQGRMQ